MSVASGVGHSPGEEKDSIPSMGSPTSRSRNKHRLDGISDGFEVAADAFDGKGLFEFVSVKSWTLAEQSLFTSQISENPSFDHCGDSSNVLTNDPSGPDFANNAEHLRPEITLVFSPTPLSGVGKRLAGKSSGEDVDSSAPVAEVRFFDVFIAYRFRKPILQHGAAEGVYLAVEGILPPEERGGDLRAAYAAEKACMHEAFHLAPSPSRSASRAAFSFPT